MKKSASITSLIGVLIFIVGIGIGIIYILTGNSIKISGTNYFIGHLRNSDGSKNKAEMTEILAIISMITSMIGGIFSAIGFIVGTKGKTRAEKKEFHKNNFNILGIGMMIGLIAAVVLPVLMPKTGSYISSNELKSMTWFYILLVVQIASFVTVIIGVWKAYINLKKPIIDSNHKEQVNEDEF